MLQRTYVPAWIQACKPRSPQPHHPPPHIPSPPLTFPPQHRSQNHSTYLIEVDGFKAIDNACAVLHGQWLLDTLKNVLGISAAGWGGVG